MTKQILLLACLLALRPAFAQTPPPSVRPGVPAVRNPNATEAVLTRFTLDFSGGTAKQLVAAIEKSMGKPLNAIIPPEHADLKLPPLKMSNVDVSQLFQALELTSQKTEAYVTSTYFGEVGGRRPSSSYQQMRTSYGFRTQGPLSDESIWYFYVEKPTLPPAYSPAVVKVCRYFSLSPYLERGQTVDDITTAIQTGWKMLGEDDAPKISFHKETKLLIAVGEPTKLETIDAVLEALRPKPASPFIDPATGIPVPPMPMNVDPATGLPVPAAPKLPQRELKTAPAAPSKP